MAKKRARDIPSKLTGGREIYTREIVDAIVETVRVPLPPGDVTFGPFVDEGAESFQKTYSRIDCLQHRLENAASYFDVRNRSQNMAPASQVRGELAVLSNRVASILETFTALSADARRRLVEAADAVARGRGGLSDIFADLKPMTWSALDHNSAGHEEVDYWHRESLDRTLAALGLLQDVINYARDNSAVEVKTGTKRHDSDEALQEWLRILFDIYRDVWNVPTAGVSMAADGRGGPFIQFVQAAAKPLQLRRTDRALVDCWRRANKRTPQDK